jgi:hypothetical protein
MFRIVFWDVLPCKIMVDNYFTSQKTFWTSYSQPWELEIWNSKPLWMGTSFLHTSSVRVHLFLLLRTVIWRWLFSGLLRTIVWYKFIDVSEVVTTSIFRGMSKTLAKNRLKYRPEVPKLWGTSLGGGALFVLWGGGVLCKSHIYFKWNMGAR